jgi:hypothetical protein
VFVIGDETPHGVGSVVFFWGSQWWKHNPVSGDVSNGIASFKGYASSADDFCGGSWSAKPGKGSPPSLSSESSITVIVTSTVNKSGSQISGNIVRILLVEPSAGDGDKWGSGVVTQVTCGSE